MTYGEYIRKSDEELTRYVVHLLNGIIEENDMHAELSEDFEHDMLVFLGSEMKSPEDQQGEQL